MNTAWEVETQPNKLWLLKIYDEELGHAILMHCIVSKDEDASFIARRKQ